MRLSEMFVAPLRFVALPFFVLALPLCAQRYVIVDSANGPGTDHTTLDAALVSAQSGDRILLRPGTGQPYVWSVQTWDREYRVLGLGPTPIRVAIDGSVRGVGARFLVVDNIEPVVGGGFFGLQIGNEVPMILHSRVRSLRPFAAGRIFTDCHFGGPLAVAGRVHVLDCEIRTPHTSWGNILVPGSVGMFVTGRSAEVWIANSVIEAAQRHQAGQWGPAGTGLQLQNAPHRVMVGGRSACIGSGGEVASPRRAGIAIPNYQYGGPTNVVIDPLVTVDGPALVGDRSMSYEIPTVSPDDAVRNQTQDIHLIGPTDSVMALLVSLYDGAQPIVTSLGDVWLDAATTFLVGAGAVDSQRDLTLSMPIPALLQVGDVLVYQAASLSPRQGFEMSIPGFAVVHD